jgi:hypothetical protein
VNRREDFRLSPHGTVRCPDHIDDDAVGYVPVPEDHPDEVRCAVCGQKPFNVLQLFDAIERIREVCPRIEEDEFVEERLGDLSDVADLLCDLLEMADQLRRGGAR